MISILVYVADANKQLHADMHKNYQLECMRRVFAQNNSVFDYIRDAQKEAKNCCQWRGVECTEGFVTTLVNNLPQTVRVKVDIELEWLPNTVNFLYLKSVHLQQPFTAEALPRDARYAGLHTMKLSAGNAHSSGTLRFDRLPPKIEEFYFTFLREEHFSVVYVPSVPSSLRMVFVMSFHRLVGVYILNAGLPAGLEAMYFEGKKCKIRSIDGEKVDARISKNHVDQGNLHFAHKAHCMDILDRIQPEVADVHRQKRQMVQIR